MKIGLIDVDGHNFPNLCLMKISAWHKAHGDSVEWYDPLASGMLDKVYMSKVFSFTPDYPYNVTAKEIIKGGSGYRIYRKDGIEYYDSDHDEDLPHEIEHIYPDYSIYYGKIKGIEANVPNLAKQYIDNGGNDYSTHSMESVDNHPVYNIKVGSVGEAKQLMGGIGTARFDGGYGGTP